MAVTFVDRAAVLGEALVVADLHLGLAAAVELGSPAQEYGSIVDRIDALVDRHSPGTVVIAGDVFHGFTPPPADAVDALARIGDRVRDGGAKLVVTPGNHDRPGMDWSGPVDRVSPEFALHGADGAVVSHGHERPTRSADTYVIGHLHPHVGIEGYDWPCYLHGDGVYDGADVLILPAFNPRAGGPAVDAGYEPAIDLPIVTDGTGLGAYRPIVWDGEAGTARAFPSLDAIEGLHRDGSA